MIEGFERLPRVMAIQPSTRGFGWAVFEGPLSNRGLGVSYANGPQSERNVLCVTNADALLSQHSPQTLVLEAYEPPHQTHRRRIDLGRALTALALHRGVEVVTYTKQEVLKAFAAWGARTRHEIAEVVSRVLVPGSKVPQKRKHWNGETFRMAAFAAAALIAAHYHKGNNQIHEEVRHETYD